MKTIQLTDTSDFELQTADFKRDLDNYMTEPKGFMRRFFPTSSETEQDQFAAKLKRREADAHLEVLGAIYDAAISATKIKLRTKLARFKSEHETELAEWANHEFVRIRKELHERYVESEAVVRIQLAHYQTMRDLPKEMGDIYLQAVHDSFKDLIAHFADQQRALTANVARGLGLETK